MPRRNSVAIAVAVTLVVVASTVAVVVNAGLLGRGAADASPAEAAPMVATAAPASTAPMTTVTVPPEPVVVYEVVDVPVEVPAPQIIYVPTPAAPAPAPPPTAAPTTAPAPTTTSPVTTTAAPAPAPDLLEFEMYDVADITVASYSPGDRLRFWAIDNHGPWVWEIEADDGSEIRVKFFNTATGGEAKFELRARDDGYRLKTEGEGFEDVERTL